MLNRYIFFTFLLFISTSAVAQFEKELARTDYVRIGKGNSSDEIAFERYSLGVTIPNKLNNKGSLLLHKIEYTNTNLNYKTTTSLNSELEDFQSVSYGLAYLRPLKNNWRLMAMLNPKISSNFKSSVSFEDIRLFGLLMLVKPINSKVTINAGLMYSSTLGSPAPIPFFNLNWKPNLNWTVNVGFPRFGAHYKLSEKTRLGVNVFVDGDNFVLSKDLFFNDEKMDNIKIMNMGGGLILKQKLTKQLNFNLSSGYTFYREFDFRDGKNSVKSYDLDNNFYLKVGVSLGL